MSSVEGGGDPPVLAEAFGLFLQQPGRSASTKNKFRNKFKLFLKKYGDCELAAVDHQVIEEWFAFLEQRKGYSEGHLAFHRSCHKTFWGWVVDEGWLAVNPVVTIKTYSGSPVQVVAASDDDVEKALRACENMALTLPDQRDAAIFALGTTGLRRSNIQAVRLSVIERALAEPVHFDDQEFFVLRTAGKEPMEAILDNRLAAIVRRYLVNRPRTTHDRFFISLNANHSSYLDPLGAEGLIRARRRVCSRANVPLISFQKMRRLTGTKVARRFGLEVAAAVLGHRSGTDVVRKHYYDPDKEAARLAALTALSRGRNWGKE